MNVEGLQTLMTNVGFGLVAYAGTFGAWYLDQSIDEEWKIMEEVETAEEELRKSASGLEDFESKYREHLSAAEGNQPIPHDYNSPETINEANTLLAEASAPMVLAREMIARAKRRQSKLKRRRQIRFRIMCACLLLGLGFLTGAAVWMFLVPTTSNP